MNKKRLLKLADLLEADAKNKKGIKFDISTVGYVGSSWGNIFDDDAVVNEDDVKVDCGTTACAMGLAAISGAFKRAGLSFRLRSPGSNHIDTTWNGRRVGYDEAAMKLFDVDKVTANFLFTPDNYEDRPVGAKGERVVAKRIRRLVAGKISFDKEEVSF